MPGFECFTNAVIAFVYDTSIVEINSMIVFPRMVGNIRAMTIVLQVPLMFLFAGLEASFGFSYVVPRTVFTWNFVNNIALKIRGLSELWRREFLLKGFEWFVETRISFLWSNLVRESVTPLMKGRHGKPWYALDGSAHLKNIETNSSGGGTVDGGGGGGEGVGFLLGG